MITIRINEISANNRLEIEYISENGFERNMKGIVLAVEDNKIIFITDEGDKVDLEKNKILYVEKKNFEQSISDQLTSIKNYYLEIYNLEQKIKELKKDEKQYIQNIRDAKFLSRFNNIGACNELNSYFKEEDRVIRVGDTKILINFQYEGKDYIILKIKAIKYFEYFNTEDKEELRRAMETYAPNKEGKIKKIFYFAEDIFLEKKYLERETDNLFKAISLYQGSILIGRDNYIKIRNDIEKILKKGEF